MASKPFEPNVFLKLKKCIAGLRKSIAFLKECLHLGLTPVSHKVVVNEKVPSKLVKKLESGFIKDSVEKLYAQLNIKTLKCYALHLKLARDYPIEFPAFLTKVKVAEKCEERRKERVLRNKLELLKARQPPRNYEKPSVAVLDGFVVNRSKEEFTDKQIDLLNKGLNYAVSRKPRMDQIIIDVETAIRSSKLSTAQKDCARAEVADVLRKGINGKSNVEEIQIAKELRRKEVFYVKADKGNSVVIMDKTDYNGLMQAKIDEGPYRVRREDPLPEMVKEVEKTLKDCGPILGFAPGALKVSAPIVPRIKGLPKIHKPGNEMREIISGVNAPTEKVAKWLLNEFKRMPKPFKTRSVTNTLEFVNRLQASGGIEEDEVMVSFDVSALFPSVPVKEASNLLEDWLLQQHNGSTWKLKVRNYKKLVDLCMGQTFFKFRDLFYRQTKGAPMGNPLSPFLCELFMAHLEETLENQDLLPEKWWRYVDDIFCVVNKDFLEELLTSINGLHKNIKFTCEIEEDRKLPFLDVLVRRDDGLFQFEIYRKPTNTMRVIPSTSNHSFQHKMAAFHHMIHRMNSIPLSTEGREKELQYIFQTANKNGYQSRSIQAIIRKKERLLQRKSFTTLTPIQKEFQRRSMEFNSVNAVELRHKLTKFDIELVFTSSNNQLKSILGSTKDPVELLHRSGVYKISCSDCDKVYIGQTKRKLIDRFEEHMAIARSDSKKKILPSQNPRSAVALHMCESGHSIDRGNVSLIRSLNSNSLKLDVAESIEIFNEKSVHLLNGDTGPGHTWLFKFLGKKKYNNLPDNAQKRVENNLALPENTQNRVGRPKKQTTAQLPSIRRFLLPSSSLPNPDNIREGNDTHSSIENVH